MPSVLRSRFFVVPAILLLAGSILPLAAQQSASLHPPVSASISTGQVVERLQQENRRRAEDLKHYSGTRTYHLEYHGLGSLSADMVVEAQFDAPATKRFRVISQHGSKLVINEVFKRLLAAEQEAAGPDMQRKTALSPENYQFQLIGQEAVGDRHCYVLEVVPRTGNKFLYRGKVWIDAQDFAVVQIEAEPARNPSFWIRRTTIKHEYTKVGEFWLPAENLSVSNIRVGGIATLTIDYGQYIVSPD
ncbi:MAG: outer membrane lipoprotein-sorting protein [Acidobacteriaceae bacterium]